jgi:hypothetical protein
LNLKAFFPNGTVTTVFLLGKNLRSTGLIRALFHQLHTILEAMVHSNLEE